LLLLQNFRVLKNFKSAQTTKNGTGPVTGFDVN